VMVTGKRYQVFSIREKSASVARGDQKGDEKSTQWIKAGSAWVNRDGSLNVYLDVLPLDGKLHVREALEKRDGVEGKYPLTNGSSVEAEVAVEGN
jgi:hypothetical protein